MKHKLIFRIFAIVLTLSLLMLAWPVSQALAAETITLEDDSDNIINEATIGDRFWVKGTQFETDREEVSIYLSSQDAEPGANTEIDDEVTIYHWFASASIISGSFKIEIPILPDILDEGDDAPEAVHGGTYYIYVTYYNSDNIESKASFTMAGIAEIGLDIANGTVNTEVEIIGDGFALNEVVTITYDSTALAIESGDGETDSNGAFILTVIIPESVFGDHTITVFGQDSLAELEAIFAMEPKIVIAPLNDNFVTVTGTGFAHRDDVDVAFNGIEVAVKKTDSDGSFDTFFAVPETVPGSYDVLAEDGDGNFAEAEFIVNANPEISMVPTSGIVGDEITVTGTGFAIDSSVTISFDGTSVGTALTSPSGSFNSTAVTVPTGTQGAHTIKAEDGDGNFAEAEFIVNLIIIPTITISPTSGVIGDEITVSGTDFSAGNNIYLYFDDNIIAAGSTGNNGDFTDILTVPTSTQGAHTIKAEDGDGNFAEATFTAEKSRPSISTWVRWLLLGLGILVITVVGFWLGMRTAYSSF